MKYIYLFINMIHRNLKWVFIKATHHKMYIKNVLGNKIILNLTNTGLDLKEKNIFKQLALDGVRERESTKIINKFIHSGDVILELGANIGYYVAIECRVLKNIGFVYAVEPSKSNLDLLQKNIRLNGFNKVVEIYPVAMSNKNGVSTIYLSKEANLNTMIKPSSGNYMINKIKTVTVDSFLKNKKPVSFIRMDIEGYEYYVLQGMKNTLKAKTLKKLFIEFHTHKIGQDKVTEMLRSLQNEGFEIYRVIFRDKTYRRILGETLVKKISIDNLIRNNKLLCYAEGFQAFFKR